MGRLVLVTIDLDRVRVNLSREDGRAATDVDVVSLLFESGFRRWEGQWLVPEEELSVLRSDEVTSLEDAPLAPKLSRLILSRDYEDRLDRLENRRRVRTAASRRRTLLGRLAAALATVGKAAAALRRR